MSDRDGGARRLRLKQRAAELNRVRTSADRREKFLQLMQIRDSLHMSNMKWPCFIELVSNAEEWGSEHNTRIIQVAYFDKPEEHAGNTHIVFPMARKIFKQSFEKVRHLVANL